MSRILTDDDVVRALDGVVDEETIRLALEKANPMQDPRQFWLVERTYRAGRKRFLLRRKRRLGNEPETHDFRERIAQLPPLDQLVWKTISKVNQ